MDSMHSDSFAIIFMLVITVAPLVAYLAVRLFGAHEAASDHPTSHHR